MDPLESATYPATSTAIPRPRMTRVEHPPAESEVVLDGLALAASLRCWLCCWSSRSSSSLRRKQKADDFGLRIQSEIIGVSGTVRPGAPTIPAKIAFRAAASRWACCGTTRTLGDAVPHFSKFKRPAAAFPAQFRGPRLRLPDRNPSRSMVTRAIAERPRSASDRALARSRLDQARQVVEAAPRRVPCRRGAVRAARQIPANAALPRRARSGSSFRA